MARMIKAYRFSALIAFDDEQFESVVALKLLDAGSVTSQAS